MHKARVKALHPDKNPGDKDAEARFKDMQSAYDLISAMPHAKREALERTAEKKQVAAEQRRESSKRQQQLQQQQQAQAGAAAAAAAAAAPAPPSPEQQAQQQAFFQQQQAAAQAAMQQAAALQQAAMQQAAAVAFAQQQQAACAAAQQGTPIHQPKQGSLPPGLRTPRGGGRTTPRGGHPSGLQFQDILQQAAREKEATRTRDPSRGPKGQEMQREGFPNDDEVDINGVPLNGRRYEEESTCYMVCMDAMTDCAKCYMLCQYGCRWCYNCIDSCGVMSEKEKREWGYRDGEQPARYRGALADQSAAIARENRARRSETRERQQTRERAAAGIWPSPQVV